jgi:Glutaredoxin-like domain (DUF836)
MAESPAQTVIANGDAPRVRVLTRVGCHLCDDALAIVRDVTRELGEGFDVVDVDGDPDLVERYGDRVPVVLVDGSEHGFWRVEPDRLRLALRGRRGWLGRTSRTAR